MPESRPLLLAALLALLAVSSIAPAAPESRVTPGPLQGQLQPTTEPMRSESAPQGPEAPPDTPQPAPDEPAQRDEAFKKLVTNVKLVGNFTLDGHEPETLQREEYLITGAKKLREGDSWALTSGIKYGDVDLAVPGRAFVRRH
jgi:hypothetical protein